MKERGRPTTRRTAEEPRQKPIRRVLIVGSSGFFGSWLCPGLSDLEVIRYDIEEGNDLFDLTNLEQKAIGCDAVILLTSLPHFKPEIPPPKYTQLNILGNFRAVKHLSSRGIERFVFASSGAIYGYGPERMDGWVRSLPITEDLSEIDWDVIDAYGASKVVVEEFLHVWNCMNQNLIITSLRINCIEPHDTGAREQGFHHGWWVSQALAIRAFSAAVKRKERGFVVVNVGEENPKLDTTRLHSLLSGEL